MTSTHDTDRDNLILFAPPKLVIGGGGTQKGNNWLGKLKQWTTFSARNPKLSTHQLFVFEIREKYTNSVVLTLLNPTDQKITSFHSPVHFSNEYELHDIYDEPEPDNRTDLDRRLEVDANAKEVNTMDGEPG